MDCIDCNEPHWPRPTSPHVMFIPSMGGLETRPQEKEREKERVCVRVCVLGVITR